MWLQFHDLNLSPAFGRPADFLTVFFGHKKGRQIALAAFADY
jgi:hypothetical protein